MGTWGTGIFENDGSGDFLAELVESEQGWALIRSTLADIAEGAEAPACEMALAAAECVAVARGKPSATPEAEVVEWCEDHPLKDPSKLAVLAARAIRFIRRSSELKDLWEGGEASAWAAVLEDLEKRLTS